MDEPTSGREPEQAAGLAEGPVGHEGAEGNSAVMAEGPADLGDRAKEPAAALGCAGAGLTPERVAKLPEERDEPGGVPGPGASPGDGNTFEAQRSEGGVGAGGSGETGVPERKGVSGEMDSSDEADESAGPRPLGVRVVPTGEAEVDAQLERLADADHLAASGHLEVYEDVHRGLRDVLASLDRRPEPPTPSPSPSYENNRS